MSVDIFHIPKAGDRTRWVNAYNLLKLTGAGNSIASVIDYAIEKSFNPEPGVRIADDRRDITVTVYPAVGANSTDLDNIRDFTLLLKEYEPEHYKCEFVETDQNFLHYAPDGRVVVMETSPVKGSDETEPNIEIYFKHGGSEDGPNSSLVMLSMELVVQQPLNFRNHHVVYCHTLSILREAEVPNDREEAEDIDNSLHYIGITKQGWQRRFKQHLSNARRGSPLLFHRALRDYYTGCKLVQHRILKVCSSEKEAMDTEEEFVEGAKSDLPNAWAFKNTGDSWFFGTLYPKGLNMIPGGYAGLKVLHKLGALRDRKPVDVDRRDQILIDALKREGRAGQPNPLISAHWNDPDYAEKIICGPEGRLSPQQINEARALELTGKSNFEIAEAVGAKNEQQIARLLIGRTYSRIGKPN